MLRLVSLLVYLNLDPNRQFDSNAEVLSIESKPITMGFQAVELSRHTVQIVLVHNSTDVFIDGKKLGMTHKIADLFTLCKYISKMYNKNKPIGL
ncbi:hypothetical protein GK047_12390 [Paenibacillus sp. SYP-B3998]|uniref:Uncharacterized protein n=1 Tax=Paenibacillus sp. SYP-B3998 TaxID=2678564 RepID=A0A6G3ZXK2_9BACL|nr:hypothetical protein [Paenibacillus sp. SYP-B3998]NEW06810.1 hypothetical protein [Paenibacillus sp. SYP-B3998]